MDGDSARRLAEGWQAVERNELRAAEQTARDALGRNPRDLEFLYLLGSSLLFQERFEEALGPLREVVLRAPRRGAGHRLGHCLLALGQAVPAEQALRREIEAHPELIDAYNALGVALIHQSRPQDALRAFEEAARRDPGSAAANNNVANVLADLGRHAEALPYLRKAIEADPGLAEAHHNLGMVYQNLKRHEEAAASLMHALRLTPRSSDTPGYVVWNKLSCCRWDGLSEEVEELRAGVRARLPVADPFVFLAVSDSSEEQRLCAESHAARKVPDRAPLWRGERPRHDRIRVAYLSADFHEHATAQLAARLFELHDRAQFEVVGVSYGPDDGSPMRERLRRAFERFLDVQGRSDEQAARLLHELEIDIAVDLKGYTTGARPGILAYRPAPIQVSYLGFPGTMGAGFIDYLLADRVVVPEADQRWYAEQVVYLPDSYQVNDDGRVVGHTPSRAEVGLPEHTFVFCCFNNSYKITRPVFSIWMRLLREVPGSVLWLLEDNSDAKRNLQQEAGRSGIDPKRLVFAERVPPARHLARQRLADLFLDTLPCNAHTTASDALWAGLPVLTCQGTGFAARVASSLLQAVGFPELVTPDLAAYESLALGLARDRSRLAAIRARLAQGRESFPLFDSNRSRLHLEAAYRTMCQIWQDGQRPRGFHVGSRDR